MNTDARTLGESRWASSRTIKRPQHAVGYQSASKALSASVEKLKRLLKRIQWKTHLLLYSASLVIASLHAPVDEHIYARSMFKLDFFEYYGLLERSIVLSLQLCSVSVTRGEVEPNDVGATHRYHANVLDALDRESCVLHSALGEGEPRRHLGLAKEFRNKWKDADEFVDTIEDRRARLEDLELEDMLTHLLRGLEKAFSVVEAECATKATKLTNGKTNGTAAGMELDDAPYEVVEDAVEMEWEL